MAIETTLWDPVDYLKTPDDELAYLEAAFEDGDPALIAAAFGDVARARGKSKVARDAGISRDALYKAFGPNGNPTLASVTKVASALGYRLTIATAQ